MKHLLRHEWDYVEIGDGPNEVTRAEADALLRLATAAAPSLGLASGAGEGEKVLLDGRFKLRLQQVVGILVAGNVTFEILPKTDTETAGCRRNLATMIAQAGDLRIASLQSVAMDSQNRDLLEMMIAAFARDLLAVLRPGIPRAYLSLEDELPALRGRLNITRQYAARAGRADILACHYDELLPDTPLTRILRGAVELLAARARRSATQRLLMEALTLLLGASSLRRGAIPQVHFDRMTLRFKPVHELACLFLRSIWQSTSSGERGGIALLFRMNVLFESWVAQILSKGLKAEGWDVHLQAKGQVRHALQREEQQLFAMYPDILLKRSDIYVILDTKWKRLEPLHRDARRRVAQSDVYQLLAYRQAWSATGVMLSTLR